MERDLPFLIDELQLSNFNSHAHVERDCFREMLIDRISISTHTLTWSVTFFTLLSLQYSAISTHTLTWSVTQDAQNAGYKPCNFNSHAHVERDCSKRTQIFKLGISTHTLTWSVTKYQYEIHHDGCISTHTLTWSVTLLRKRLSSFTFISTHTLTWSVTFRQALQVGYNRNFNSHAHVERDSNLYAKNVMIISFQLTRSRGA